MTDQRIPQVGEVWRAHVEPMERKAEILAIVEAQDETWVVYNYLPWGERGDRPTVSTQRLDAFLRHYEPVPNVPPVPERLRGRWVNVYSNGAVVLHTTRENANGGDGGRIALVRWDGWDEDGKLTGEVVQ